MSVDLKLKRTKKALTNLSQLDDTILLEGEPFVVLLDKISDGSYSSDVTLNPHNKHALLFTGDGHNKISDMYAAGKFTYISKYVSSDMLEDNSVGTSQIQDNSVTYAKLSDDLEGEKFIDASIPWDKLPKPVPAEWFTAGCNIPYAALSDDSLINLNKLYNVKCETVSNSEEKIVNVNVPVSLVDPEDPASAINVDDYLGLTLIVRFTYGNTANNPRLVVKTLNNQTTLLDAVIMVGDTTISSDYSYFNWQAHDSLVFTFTKLTNNSYSWQMAGTSASRVLGSWCYNNDTTMINGGMIATGSISAQKIAAKSISSDQIASGSLSADVLSEQFSYALNNLTTIEQQSTSSRQIICICDTAAGVNPKEIYLEGKDALAVSVGGSNDPVPGTTLVVKFMNPNTLGTYGSTTTSLKLMLDSIPFPPGIGNGYSVVTYKDNISEDVKNDQFLNWTSVDNPEDNIRTLIFNGSEWEVQPTNVDLLRAARWCYDHDQTYIQGGNIVSGRIFADQITAGSLNIGNISIYSADGDGRAVASLERFIGEADGVQTYGMMLAGSDKDHFYIAATNKGCRIQGGNGGVIFSYGGTTIDENGNYIDSTGGYSGIDHNRVIQIGHSDGDGITQSISIKASTINFECNTMRRRVPGGNWQNM